MPRLTRDNLIALARAARQHGNSVEALLPSVDELRQRNAALPTKRCDAVLHVFGPKPELFPSPFTLLWSMGLMDCLDHPHGSKVDGVSTIEQYLPKVPGSALRLRPHRIVSGCGRAGRKLVFGCGPVAAGVISRRWWADRRLGGGGSCSTRSSCHRRNSTYWLP